MGSSTNKNIPCPYLFLRLFLCAYQVILSPKSEAQNTDLISMGITWTFYNLS